MRAAISIFAELLQDDETLRLKRELRWLTGRLGPARDLHLLARQIRRSRSQRPGASKPARRCRPAPRQGLCRRQARRRLVALSRLAARSGALDRGRRVVRHPDARRQPSRRRRIRRSGDRQTRTQGAAAGDRAARAERRAAASAAHRGEEIVLRDRLLRDAVHRSQRPQPAGEFPAQAEKPARRTRRAERHRRAAATDRNSFGRSREAQPTRTEPSRRGTTGPRSIDC